ncbi:MAG: hypothetical protein PHY48_06860 [Candidatus Cloacimonetes bacterium]|nr:hypothetical protein [Candidatus Cloacimonadota bacterium]
MIRLLVIIIVSLLLLSACAPGLNDRSPEKPAGFLWGIWHGWIAPFSLVLSIFVPEVSIYESNNTGFWYDLGYYLAIIGGFGGLALSRRRKRRGC